MENKFEKYLEQNRDRFEKDGPPPQVWKNIERALIARQQKRARIVRVRLVGWSVAAGVLIGVSISYLAKRSERMPLSPITLTKPTIKKPTSVQPDTLHAEKPAPAPIRHRTQHVATAPGVSGDQTINYYASLVAQRQQQFKQLKTLDPGLYNESQKAIANLNATYNQLQSQLNGTVNRKKIVEMMIENLQLQERILANQLQLIHDAEQKNGADDETL